MVEDSLNKRPRVLKCCKFQCGWMSDSLGTWQTFLSWLKPHQKSFLSLFCHYPMNSIRSFLCNTKTRIIIFISRESSLSEPIKQSVPSPRFSAFLKTADKTEQTSQIAQRREAKSLIKFQFRARLAHLYLLIGRREAIRSKKPHYHHLF